MQGVVNGDSHSVAAGLCIVISSTAPENTEQLPCKQEVVAIKLQTGPATPLSNIEMMTGVKLFCNGGALNVEITGKANRDLHFGRIENCREFLDNADSLECISVWLY